MSNPSANPHGGKTAVAVLCAALLTPQTTWDARRGLEAGYHYQPPMNTRITACIVAIITSIILHPITTHGEEKAAALPKSLPLEVTNPVVKRVKVPGVFSGEKIVFRYFFMVRNNSNKPFSGQVRIQLINKTTGTKSTRKETFKCDIPAGGVANNFFDASTGPERIHGDYSIIGYEFEAKVEEAVVASGKFALTDRFEDLTR